MDRTDAIAVFIAVADHGSFAAAARRLGRSPASVTRAVADLESRLGVRLLTRTTRAVSTTEAGQRFLGGAKRVLADLDEIERAAAGQGTAPRGELRLTAPILFGRLHVLPIVTEFLDRFPEVQAALALVDRPVDLVEEGLDVAVRIGALGESSAVATRVGALRRIVVASPDYLARRGTPQRPADLTDHAVVAFSGIAGVEHWVFREAARRRERCHTAPSGGEHGRGRDRRGEGGLRAHARAQLPGRRGRRPRLIAARAARLRR